MWFPPSELVRKKQIMPNILYATPTWVWRIHNTWPHGKATGLEKNRICVFYAHRGFIVCAHAVLCTAFAHTVFFLYLFGTVSSNTVTDCKLFQNLTEVGHAWVFEQMGWCSNWWIFFGNPWNLEDSNTSFGKKSGWLPQIMFRRWPSGSRDSHVEGDPRLKAIASAFNFNLYSCSDLYNDMFWRTWTIALLLVGNLALHSRAWI